ncbi:MAG: LysM peptidoglycan-binding domain-containing protein, partial [Candidatus Eremiobacterota bacterium]
VQEVLGDLAPSLSPEERAALGQDLLDPQQASFAQNQLTGLALANYADQELAQIAQAESNVVTIQPWGTGENDCVWNALKGAGYTDEQIVEYGLIDQIAEMNNLEDPNLVHPGQQLAVPTPEALNRPQMEELFDASVDYVQKNDAWTQAAAAESAVPPAEEPGYQFPDPLPPVVRPPQPAEWPDLSGVSPVIPPSDKGQPSALDGVLQFGDGLIDHVNPTTGIQAGLNIVGIGLETGGDVISNLAEGDLAGAGSAYLNGLGRQIGVGAGYAAERIGNVVDMVEGANNYVNGVAGAVVEYGQGIAQITGNGLSSTGQAIQQVAGGDVVGALETIGAGAQERLDIALDTWSDIGERLFG